MTIKITYFVHGTTIDNEKGLASGWADAELSELGKKQSIELKDLIYGKKFNIVFCSDLRRAIDSAELTFDNKMKIIPDKRLREINYGDLTRTSSEKVDSLMFEHIDRPFPKGESYKDVEKRMRSFLDDLKEYEGKNVAIVAHRGPQLALDVILNGKSWEQAMKEDWRHRGHAGWKPGWKYNYDKNVNKLYLKNLALKKGIDIGVAVNNGYLNDKNYRKIIINEFNVITTEYELNFLPVHPIRGKDNFKLADKVVSFARKNKIKVRGHPLVWHHKVALPNWIIKGKFTKEEFIEILGNHIKTVVGRYKGKITDWTVVNEAIDDNNKLRKGIWLKNIGPDYIEMAFHFAHEANPKAKLYYNDYNIDDLNKKSDAVYRLIKKLLRKGVPIHGIGLQMHLLEEIPLNPENVEKNIRRFKKLGLEVSITEMDVRIKKPITHSKIENQAIVYHDMLKAALKTKCNAFILWGVSDANSWIPHWYKNYDAALIFDKKYKPKPAYEKLKEALL